MRTGKLRGAEALVCWEHPEQGLIAPFEFITVAENSGQIHALGFQVFENALKDLSVWQTELDFKGKVAINLSAKQFNHSELLDIIQGLFNKHQVEPNSVELEVTESVLLKEVDHAITIIKKLKMMGLTVAIDDIGTGYSSLSYLRKIPFDTLKLDKSFIDDIAIAAKSRILVESIVQLALGLELDVVAEGETHEQAVLLQEMQCGQCQGYLFSKPVNKIKFAEMISQSKSFLVPEAQTN